MLEDRNFLKAEVATMKTIFAYDPWRLVENELHKDDMRLSESMTSIGNGHMGMRGNFEEQYSGDSHRGTYLAGVWFPDKTRVGWWKNGYPQYFGKVINAMNTSPCVCASTGRISTCTRMTWCPSPVCWICTRAC